MKKKSDSKADLFTGTIWAYFVHLNFQHTRIQDEKKKREE